MTAAPGISAPRFGTLEPPAIQNRKGRVAHEGLVVVGTSTTKEGRAARCSLFPHEPTIRASAQLIVEETWILWITRHSDSLQSIDHV